MAFRDLLKSELLRNASILISGTVMAQMISILLQPLLRRLFSPESFGVYSVYLSLIGIVTVISSFRYDDAIVLPKADRESANVIGLSLLFNLSFNLLLLVLVIILGERIITFLNLPGTFPVAILYLIPLGAFLYNTYQCLNYWLIRKKRYSSVSVNKIMRRGSEGISQVTCAFARILHGLIYSDLIGQAVNVITVTLQATRNGFSLKSLSAARMKYVFRKYIDFPKFNLVPALMSTCSYMLPPIFINKFYSPESAGFFDLAKLLLSVPLALVATSFSNVLLQRVSDKFNRKESFIGDFKPVLAVVSLISLTELVIIILFGEEIFKFLFGETWTFSGRIAGILVWSFTLNFIVSTFTTLFFSMRKIRIYSIYQVIYFIAIISLLFFKKYGFVDFLRIYVIIEVACYFVLISIMVTLVTRYEMSLRTQSI